MRWSVWGVVLLLAHCGVGADECLKSVFYRDVDGDGFGDSAAYVEQCLAPGAASIRAPAGFSVSPTDCADGDPRAHPGAGPQASPIDGPTTTISRWDFNCDGATTLGQPFTDTCVEGAGTCGAQLAGGFWQTPSMPGCGESGLWVLTCSVRSGACAMASEQRVQSCR